MAGTMTVSRLDPLWADYQTHHRSAGNRWCHAVGIPLILAGLLGLLAVPVFEVEGARVEASLLLIAVMAGLYLWLDAKLGAALVAATLLLYLGARLLDWRVSLGLLVAGWIFQFAGHLAYEKRSPAFFHNLAHLLVGPLWVLNHALRLRR